MTYRRKSAGLKKLLLREVQVNEEVIYFILTNVLFIFTLPNYLLDEIKIA